MANIIGVDLGGTTTKIAFLNKYGELLHKWEIPTDKSENGKNIIVDIAKAIDKKLEDLDQSKDKLVGIGMGAPGPVDMAKGIIYEAVNLGWDKNTPLKDLLEIILQQIIAYPHRVLYDLFHHLFYPHSIFVTFFDRMKHDEKNHA